jgi:hypothetical protein
MRCVRIGSVALLGALLVSPLGAATRRMFVTSVAGSGNLSTWADAGGHTGVAAGDAICQARAVAASLPNAAAYRAWLSNSLDDAYCRMHDLTGKRADNCGQPTLPAEAGPWWRTDGEPFGDGLPALVLPLERVLNPPEVDEFGATIVRSVTWTGTGTDGSVQGDHCADWTSAAGGDLGADGDAGGTSAFWTSYGSGDCSTTYRRLLCFEIGLGDPLPAFPAWGRLAFLTSAHGNGDLGSWPEAGGATGVAAGDAICQNLATAAGIHQPGSFKAWLSDDGTNAIDRFQHDGPWLRLDGIEVAASKADLTDQHLETSINLTEAGAYLGNWAVWTGTGADGTVNSPHCAGWTSGTAGTGNYGATGATFENWTSQSETSCDFVWSYLYCLQDLPLVFFDGFDTGGTTAWTATVP